VPVRLANERLENMVGWWIPGSPGDTKAVLYLHGNDGNVSVSVNEVTPLRQLQYSVLLIDYRGFGTSDGGFPSEASVYQDAEAAWKYLVNDRGIKPAELYIYGHSLGGAIAIELARHHPEAAGLIVESSFTSIYEMSRLDYRYRMLPVNLFLNQRFESISKISEVKLPALFMHGTDDDIVPFWMGEELFAVAPEPKRFVPIEHGKHDHDASGVPTIRAAVERFVQETALKRTVAAH
jgi:pimeloyl-ACP methyl ester carboxylesterase